MVSMALYPLAMLDEARGNGGRIIIGGGEWDVLRTIQEGYYAITRTASEITWMAGWSPLFKDVGLLRGARLR